VNLLDTVAELVKKRPLDTQAIEDAFDVALRADADNTNPYIRRFLAFRRPAELKSVEVRVPLGAATRKGPIVVLDVDGEATGIKQADVLAQFGNTPAVEVPSPQQPPDSPVYLSYPQPWGTLRFGFARPSTELLTSVVIDSDKLP
jgi:hypothetical protein